MRRTTLAVLFLGMAAAWGADDWVKVKAIRSGSDLKIWRAGSKQALEAKMDEATDESLVVATKKEQFSIPKDQIDRIDARAPKDRQGPRRTTTATTTTGEIPGTDPHKINRPGGNGGGPSGNVTSTANWSSAPFETVYRKK